MSQATALQTAAAVEAGSQEFLVFSLGDEEYAIDILKVQEIRGYENVTRIANAPEFIKGVANLRGVIVPIVDLRIKFRLERADYDDQTVVIVVNIADRVVGHRGRPGFRRDDAHRRAAQAGAGIRTQPAAGLHQRAGQPG